MPTVSIIIPCREVDHYSRRCVKYCERQIGEPNIVVVPDSTFPGYPAAKRNWAMANHPADIYAFIDSDAYPSPHWLETALYFLQWYPAVCGPGVLPYDAPHHERISDLAYQMLPYAYRVTPMTPRVIAEYPTFNLIVRADAVGLFQHYLTGEDSLFCRAINGGVFYHPDILVYHNRRPAFRGLWKQVATYGRHRGNFVKKALLAWLTTIFTYSVNFVRGFIMKEPS